MVDQIISKVNWATVFYICFALLILIILDKVLGFSFAKFFAGLATEFKSLIGRGSLDRGRLNAILLLLLFALCAFYFFVEPVKHLVDLANAASVKEEHPEYVGIAAFFSISVVGYLSVLSTGQP
jgi:hypothetical protein